MTFNPLSYEADDLDQSTDEADLDPLTYKADHVAADQFAQRALTYYIEQKFTRGPEPQRDDYMSDLYNAFESFKQRYETKVN